LSPASGRRAEGGIKRYSGSLIFHDGDLSMKTNAALIVAAALALAGSSALAAGKDCEELKAKIAAKLDGKKVTGYTLDIVDADKTGDAKVVGSCGGGAKKITYVKK
jgi:hypothetical protein